MKQSCTGKIIWIQVKQRKATEKLHRFFLFHLKFVKLIKFFQVWLTEPLKKYLSNMQIFEKIIDKGSFT